MMRLLLLLCYILFCQPPRLRRTVTRRRFFSGVMALALSGLFFSAPAESAIFGLVAPAATAVASGPGTLTLINTSSSVAIPSGSVSRSFGWFFAQGAIPAVAVTTGTITSGTNSLSVASAANMATNQCIICDGIPTGTYITNVSGTTITLSRNAIANVSGGSVVIPGAPSFAGGLHGFSWGQHVLNVNDNSLKYAVFALKLGSSISANSHIAIAITNGGNAHPTPSGYTFTDFYNEGVVVTGAAYGSSLSNARTTSTVRSYLQNDSNNLSQQIDFDGAAGLRCKFITHMITGAQGSATADALLYCEHFIWKFPGASSAEIRWLGAITQPVYNGVTLPQQTVFGSASWSINGGSQQAIVNLPAENFTAGAGSSANIGSGAYYTGVPNGLGVNGTPVIASSTGTLDTGIAGNTLYWATQGASTNNVGLATANYLGGSASFNGNGTGTQTFTPQAVSIPFDRLFFAGTDANYQHWVVGATSPSADVTMRHQIDQVAWKASDFFPPYGQSGLGFANLSAGTTTTVVDNSYSYGWNPYSIGNFDQETTTGGDRDSIGLLPQQHVAAFYNQSQTSETLVRIGAMAGAHIPHNFLDATTLNLINIMGPSASYRGLPSYDTNVPAWVDLPSGFTNIPATRCTIFDSGSTEHMANHAFFGYCCYGERHMLDILEEKGVGAFYQQVSHLDYRNPTLPTSVCGSSGKFGVLINGENRTVGWALRNNACAAGMTPTVSPDGSQRGVYIRALLAQETAFFAAMIVSANNYYTPSPGSSTVQSYLLSTGNFILADYSGNGGTGPAFWNWSVAMFEQPYLMSALLLAADLCQDANAAAVVKTTVTFYDHINTKFGVWTLWGYYQTVYTTQNPAVITISSDAAFGVNALTWYSGGGGVGSSVSWNGAGFPGAPSGQRFQVTPGNRYVAANGDQFTWDASVTGLPSTISIGQAVYVINASTLTGGVYYFDFSPTSGGSPLGSFSGTGTINQTTGPAFMATSVSPYNSTSGAACSPLSGGPADMLGVANWCSTRGITGINNITTPAAVIAAMGTQIANTPGGIDFTSVCTKYYFRAA